MSASLAREAWRRRLGRLLVLIVPLLILTLALILQGTNERVARVREAEQQSQERRAMILSVLSAHQDVETGQRGYLITGRRDFLDPYRTGLSELDRILAELRKTYAQNPAELEELGHIDAYSRQKREFAAASIALYDAGDKAGATRMIMSGRGKRLMDTLRVHIGTLLEMEVARLENTSENAQRAIAASRYATFGLLLLLLSVLAAAGAAISRTLKSRNDALLALEDVSLRRKAILDSAMDAIVTLNPSGTIEGLNAAAIRMFGYGEEELLRRDVGQLFAAKTPIGAAAALLRDMNLVEGQPGTLQEIIGRRKDGSTFPADVAVTVTHLAEGRRYVAVIRDITERSRVERMKSEFVSTVSHELRTPLTSIAGSLGLLAGGAAGPLQDKAAHLVMIARNNAERLVRLINDILDIEKLESGKMPFTNAPLDLNAAAQEAIEANRGYADQYRVRLELQPAPEPAMVSADRDRLAQVLANLLSNAIKFSDEGGAVEVVVATSAGSHTVSVIDHGRGIPEEFRDRIFGKFAQADASDTRQKGGTGLGLSIVREIVTRLDGTIDFDSVEGEGTRFVVTLPQLHPATPDRVLVCGALDAAQIAGALGDADREAVFEPDPDAAMRRAASEPFGAIVVDMGLPAGSGIAIIRAVRSSTLNSATPVLALGGSPAERGQERDAALIVDWLHKPADLPAVPERIEAAIGARALERPRVLHVDDDPDVLRVVSAALEGQAEVTPAQSVAAARRRLAEERFDLVVLDLTLADGSGIELLPALARAGEKPIPVLIFSAEDADPQTASQVGGFLTKARTPMHTLVEAVDRLAARPDTQRETNEREPE